MASKALPSPEVLRQLLRYEPDTGKLFWLPRPLEAFKDSYHRREVYWAAWETRFSGQEAFTARGPKGHKVGIVLGAKAIAHRVIWAMQTGAWPDNQIDHINRDPSDNRWSNLRDATNAENCRNRGISSRNTSGFKGVSWHKRTKVWHSNIKKDGRIYFLGQYTTPELAHAAYVKASMQMHGVFGRAD